MKRAVIALGWALGVVAFAHAQAPSLVVSAASSLTDVLTELRPAAEAAVGAPVVYNFAGSGTLRRQVEEGAPVDVVFTAAAEDMDRLQREGLIATATRVDVLSNSVVLVGSSALTPAGSLAEVRALLSAADFVAIGNPDVVPAGRYAVQALTTYGLYGVVEKKLVLGNTVREVLQYVQSGSAPLGVVFATDALTVKPSDRVRTLFAFPADALAEPVLYPAAVVRGSKNPAAARKMVDFLRSSPAREAFARAGFKPK